MSESAEQEHHPADTHSKRSASDYIVLGAFFAILLAPVAYMLTKTTTWQEAVVDSMCVLLAAGVIALYVAMFRAAYPPVPAEPGDPRADI